MTKKARRMKIDHKKKSITVFQKLNPPSFHAWMIRKVTTENPGYTIHEHFDS